MPAAKKVARSILGPGEKRFNKLASHASPARRLAKSLPSSSLRPADSRQLVPSEFRAQPIEPLRLAAQCLRRQPTRRIAACSGRFQYELKFSRLHGDGAALGG